MSQEWALDFVHDAVECGRAIQVLSVAKKKIAAWRIEYNDERPHSSLGYKTLKEFATTQAAGFLSVEREARDSNAVPCPSYSPYRLKPKDGKAESCRILA